MDVASAAEAAPAYPGLKRCKKCGRDYAPEEGFYPKKVRGTVRYDSPCKRCVARAHRERYRRKTGGTPRRNDRKVNGRGEVWCAICRAYRHADHFRPHPSRPGQWWWCCRECYAGYERERGLHRRRDPERERANRERSRDRRAARRAAEHASRRKFVADGLVLLRRRGFTKAETARLLGVSPGAVYRWEGGSGPLPAPNAAERVRAALLATAHLAVGDPPRGRRLPHPDLAMLLAALEPQWERYPLRNGWRSGRRSAADGGAQP